MALTDNVNLPQAWVISALIGGFSIELMNGGVASSKLSEPYRQVFEWAMGYSGEYGTLPTLDRLDEQFPDVLIPEYDDRPIGDVLDRFFEDLDKRLLRAAVVEIGNSVAADDGRATQLWADWNSKIAGDTSRFQVVSWKDTAGERFDSYLDRIARNEAGESVGTGIMTGIKHLDRLTYGFMPGNYVLILGRYDTGKTTLMTKFMIAAVTTGNVCMVISPEHSAEEMARKLDAMMMTADPMALRRGTIDKSLIGQLEAERDKIRGLAKDIKIIPGSGRTLDEISAYVTALRPDVIYVDGIGHLHDHSTKGQADWLRLGMISRGLKALAANTGIPVVTVIQESKGGKDPKDSIARSDMIGRDADIIVHLEEVTPMQLKLSVVKYRETAERGGVVYLDKGERGVEFIEVDGEDAIGGADFYDFL